jgi:hypothetical protein
MPTPALNNVYTYLDGAIGSTTNSIALVDASAFPVKGWASIGGGADQYTNEVISWTGKTGDTLTGVTRGADGTVAEAHAGGSIIGISVIARHITELQVTYGTSSERATLALAYTTEEIGRRFWDTDVEELFVWMGSRWAIPTITVGSDRGVRDYIASSAGELSAILAEDYRKGDRLTDLTSPKCRLLICRVDTITHSLSDWKSVGRIN